MLFIQKPSVDLYPGMKVDRDSAFEYTNERVDQELNDLVFRSKTKVKGESFESVYDTTIYLKEGDVLIFEDEGRGYIKPVEEFVTVAEAIDELSCIKDMG